MGCLVFAVCALAASVALANHFWGKHPPVLARLGALALPRVAGPPALTVPELSAVQRSKGLSECMMPDPLGLGPYSPYERVSLGRMLVPQKGGHTSDMGFDVLIHFNGAEAVRKLLVQVAGGIAIVLIDRGSPGEYSRLFDSRAVYPELQRSIEAGLKRHCGDTRAHVRHLALSSWSAGTVAVTKLLAQKQPGIDAAVVLDGLHSGWALGAPHVPALSSLNPEFIRSAIEFGQSALRGESIFVLTHSEVEPGTYPSTSLTAELLVRELGQKATRVSPGARRFGQVSAVDVRGLHVWGFRGGDELAHCAQIGVLGRAVTEVLEPAWKTPRMDRGVPRQALPSWERKRH